MKLIITDEFKDKAKTVIAVMLIVGIVVLLAGIAGGIEMGTIG
ncbi:hypothetical protein [Carnobacterium pleistocenium]|nr:hypothetical protein [Carnobacterium pleistocenium]